MPAPVIGEPVRLRIAKAAMWIHLLVAPQCLGGVFPWGVALAALGGVLAFTAALWAQRPTYYNRYLTLLFVIFAAGLGWTLLQAAPLPCQLVEFLQPIARDHARTTGDLIGRSLPCTLSLDPGNTRLEALKGVALLCTAMAAGLLSSGGHRASVLTAAASSVGLMAAVALGHYAIGATRVYGVYVPPGEMPSGMIAPLMNSNHLGGFLAFGAPLLLGVAIGVGDRQLMALLLVVASLVVVAGMLTLSRGAIAALAVGCVGLTLWSWRYLRRRTFGPVRVGAAALAVAAAAAGAGLLVFDTVLVQFETGNFNKLELQQTVLGALLEQPMVGVGRGAFTVAFLPYAGGTIRYAYTESLPSQWAFEWGVPFAVTLAMALAWLLASAFRTARRPAERGACIGLLVLVLQNLVDYNLELAGVSVVATAALAALAPRGRRKGVRRVLRRSAGWAMASLASVCAAWLTWDALGSSAHQQRARASQLATRGDAAGAFNLVLDGLEAHPAEPILIVLGATHAVKQKRHDAFRWLNRAMMLAPLWGAPHALAGAALWNMRRYDQALIELREAGRLDWRSARELLCALVARDAAVLTRALPEGPNRLPLAESVQSCLAFDTPHVEIADRFLQEELPEMDAPFVRDTRRRFERGDYAGAWQVLRGALADNPKRANLWSALAHYTVRAGEPRRALSICEEAAVHVLETAGLVEVRARAEAALGRGPQMRESIWRLRAKSAGQARGLARAMRVLGELEAQLGNLPLAVRAYERAVAYTAEKFDLLKLAGVAERLGDRPRALRAYSDVCRRWPEDGAGCAGKRRIGGSVPRAFGLPK